MDNMDVERMSGIRQKIKEANIRRAERFLVSFYGLSEEEAIERVKDYPEETVNALLKAEDQQRAAQEAAELLKAEEEQRKSEEEQAQKEYERFLKTVPPKYREADLDRDFPNQGGLIAHTRKGGSALLLAPYGYGKTHFAWALIKDVMKKDPTQKCAIVKASDLLSRVKGMTRIVDDLNEWSTEEYGERYHLLIIDEIDKITGTQADMQVLSHLIDWRYEWQKPTIVMGNSTPDTFIRKVGGAAYSRLTGESDGGKLYYIENAPDRRK